MSIHRVLDGTPHMQSKRGYHKIIAVMPPGPKVHKSLRKKTVQKKSMAHLIAIGRECRQLLPTGLLPIGPVDDGAGDGEFNRVCWRCKEFPSEWQFLSCARSQGCGAHIGD